MTRLFLILFVFLAGFFPGFSQNSVTVKLRSLRPGDSCTITIQKSSEQFKYVKVFGDKDSLATTTFTGLSNGKWAVKLDATGYYYPSAKVVDLNASNLLVEATLTLITPGNSVNYQYDWKDDSSYVGHAQQSYINTGNEIIILNDTLKIPDDFSSAILLNRYGLLLSDKVTPWTRDDAYRLFQMVKKVETSVSGDILSTNTRPLEAVWEITDQEVADDIRSEVRNGMKYVLVSRKAFTYATPLVAQIDGIKGKFFSKRLFHAVVKYYTDFGTNSNAIDNIAQRNYGFRFLPPGPELANIMKVDASNFMYFSAAEKLTILSMIEELPEGLHKQASLKYMARRMAGQVDPIKPEAGAIAFTGLGLIEFMDGGFASGAYSDVQRLVLHEKAHFLWSSLFDQQLKEDWIILGGWYTDPTVASGWSTTKTTEFVSAYAHAMNPDEDMAETISFYVTNPDKLLSRSIRKYEFIRDRVMHGTRYVSQIREDLTFRVYNLYPDYNYPGKITGVKVRVEGAANEDKKLIVELNLHAIDSTRDGAVSAFTRLTSSAGTFFDLSLLPIDGKGFVLRGERSITKFAKSGYYTVNQIALKDRNGNERYENNNTFGIKVFIHSPNEDVIRPEYKDTTLKFSLGRGKFTNFGPSEEANGKEYQYLQANFAVTETNDIDYLSLNMAMPANPVDNSREPIYFGVLSNDPRYIVKDPQTPALKRVVYRYPIPEYFPSGFYTVTMLVMKDIAQNMKWAYFMRDTTLFTLQPDGGNSKHIHDSIEIKTQFPDVLPPILELNTIKISATPTNPSAPDGETLFELQMQVKDTSAFAGKESGFRGGYYTLRDPQGKQFTYNMQGDLNKQFGRDVYYPIEDMTGNPGAFYTYRLSTLLPKGSAPGIWGVESMTLYDRAGNKKYYSFTEIVRFDVEEADSSQMVTPKVAFLGKIVNKQTVDSVSLSIACATCKDKKYRIRVYSDMGGESAVREGKMTADSIVVKNMQLSKVNDGVLYATVFILDSSNVMLGLGKTSFSKDVVAPRSTQLKTNLSGYGKSNIDQFIVDIKVTDLKGEYTIKAKNEVAKDSVVVQGNFSDSSIRVTNMLLKNLTDGRISVEFTPVDTAGNVGETSKTLVYKDTKDPEVSFVKHSMNGRKAVYAVQANEYISNVPLVADILPGTGTVDSVKRITGSVFHVFLSRVCNDTVKLNMAAGILKDTVGNTSSAVSLSEVDVVVPVKPVVTNASGTLSVPASYAQYQWIKDGADIVGAGAAEFKPTASGTYSVRVQSAAGCSVTSETISFVVTSLTNVYLQQQGVRMYPNPVKGYFWIEAERAVLKPMRIELFDVLGRVRLATVLTERRNRVEANGLTPGVYFLRFNGIPGAMKVLVE